MDRSQFVYIFATPTPKNGVLKVGRSLRPMERLTQHRRKTGLDFRVITIEKVHPDLAYTLEAAVLQHCLYRLDQYTGYEFYKYSRLCQVFDVRDAVKRISRKFHG